MTENKPIIIDGVDVSGCEAYKDEHCKDKTSIMFCNTNLCSNFPNCYFKQLASKTQECEELKERFKNFHDRKLDENADLLCKLHKKECLKFKAEQKLKKIKPILEYYANSYIGKKQLDGIYKYDLGNENCILYDPRKAEEGLKIIDEVK